MIIRVIEDRGAEDYIKTALTSLGHTVEFSNNADGIWDALILVLGNGADPDAVALLDFDLKDRVIFAAQSWTSGMRSLAHTYSVFRLIKYPFLERKLIQHLEEINENRRIY